MALNVGELAAYVTLDNSQFNRGVDQSRNVLASLGSYAKTAGQAVATTLTAGAAAATTMGVKLVQAGVSYNVLQQNSRAALTTLLGSQTAVNAQMEKLNELASRSPFGKNLFISAQQQLISFGMSAEKVIPTLDAVQNAVAATGGSGQQLSEITYVLAQIQAAGKITATDLMQLGQRGIDAATLMGNSLGKSGSQIRQDITAGSLDANTAITALVNGMTAKFGGATDLIKQQWTGATDRIKAAWRDTGGIIAQPFIDPNGGGQAVIWANLVADTMRTVQKVVASAMQDVDAHAGPVFDKITGLLRDANVAATKFSLADVYSQFDQLAKYTPIISGAATALLTLGLGPVPVLGALAKGIWPVVAGVAALAASSPELRAVGTAFTDALAPAAPTMSEAAKAAADLGMQLIDTAAPGLKALASNGGRIITDLAPLVPMFIDLLSAATPVVGVVGDLVSGITSLPTPVLAAAAAIVAFHAPLGAVKAGLSGLGGVAGDAAAGLSLFIGQAKQTGVIDAAKQSVGGLSGVMAALGGPVGLVGIGLTALTGIIVAYAAKQAEAKATVDDFTQALEASNGVIDESIRKTAYDKLDDGIVESFEKIGISARTLVDYLTGDQEAIDQVHSAVKAHATEYASSGMYGMTSATVKQSTEWDNNLVSLDNLKAGFDEGEEGYKQLKTATQDATDAAKAQKEALDAVYDALQKQAAANGDLVAAQYQTKDSMAAMTDAAQKLGQAQLDSSGRIDVTSDANRAFVESGLNAVDSINKQMDALKASGATQEQLDANANELKDSFYDQARAVGLSGDQLDDFAQKLGLIPERVSTVIDMTVDDQAAQVDIDELVKKANEANGTLTINASDNPAMEKLAQSLHLVEVSTGVYSVDADTDPALAALFASIGTVDEANGTITINGDNQKAKNAIAAAQNYANGTSASIEIDGRDYASAVADRIVRYVNGLGATIKVGAVGSGMTAFTNANGNIVDYYAAGGVRRENHVAQIAPAGAWRVWAEDETEGEGYIPFAQSKRARSTQIMAEIAHRFGDVYIPRSARTFADGSSGGSTTTTATGSLVGLSITGTLAWRKDGLVELIDGRIIDAERWR